MQFCATRSAHRSQRREVVQVLFVFRKSVAHFLLLLSCDVCRCFGLYPVSLGRVSLSSQPGHVRLQGRNVVVASADLGVIQRNGFVVHVNDVGEHACPHTTNTHSPGMSIRRRLPTRE